MRVNRRGQQEIVGFVLIVVLVVVGLMVFLIICVHFLWRVIPNRGYMQFL